MRIEQFVALSVGEWKSMRSGHSLAFQVFEEVLSTINIELVDIKNQIIQNMLDKTIYSESEALTPFKISWKANSNWENADKSSKSSGNCYLIPIPESKTEGILIRSIGYIEEIDSISNYKFSDDQTFILKTAYNNTIIEERIWFISNNVRCRSSVVLSSNGKSILQTSFASEVRKLN